MKHNWHSRAALAALSIFIVGTSVAPQVQRATGIDGTAQAQVQLDQRPAAELNNDELEARIGTLRDLIQNGDLSKADRRALRTIIKADRAEILGRRAVGEGQPSAAGDTEQTQVQETEASETRQAEQPAAAPETQEQPEVAPASEETAESSEPSDAQRAARVLLDGAEAASGLSEKALLDRIERAEALAVDDTVRRRLRRQLSELADADRAEIDRRQTQAGAEVPEAAPAEEGGQTQAAAADKIDMAKLPSQVRAILEDMRAPSELGDRELRERLQGIRSTLQDVAMTRDQSRLVRERMRADRQELRARVAEAEGLDQSRETASSGDSVRSSDSASLRDDRPAQDLDRRELRDRIQAARDRLERDDLSSKQRDRLTTLMRADRGELRSRRQANREERRRELREQRDSGSINIIIGGDFSIGVSGNAAVAEIDDEELMLQLTAGPRRDVHERYDRDELRDHDEWRDQVPGVEVDTINFAFNEYRIGAEEIDELERIGTVLEQIVAAHPDEVYAIEGHTDAVGGSVYNQELAEKRADAVRNALVEYFVIEPENLIAIGYGERYLRIPTEEAERENRRVTLRRATPYLEGAMN